MRLFLALELDDECRQHLVAMQAALEPLLERASLTKPQNLHVTLKFLGEVDDRRTSELQASLKKATGPPRIELRAARLARIFHKPV